MCVMLLLQCCTRMLHCLFVSVSPEAATGQEKETNYEKQEEKMRDPENVKCYIFVIH